MTGIGPVGVRRLACAIEGLPPRMSNAIRFTPAILPPYARRTRSLEVLIPILYLKGISTGDFEGALAALLGKDAPGLSASTIARLKEVWLDEHEYWRKRDLVGQASYGLQYGRSAYLQAVSLGRQIGFLQYSCSSSQTSFRRAMVEADRPGASLPSRAASAPRSHRSRCPSGKGSGSAPPGSWCAARRAAGSPA